MIPDHSDHTTSKDESKQGKDTSVHFMYYACQCGKIRVRDLRSLILIWIIPKENTPK